MIQLLISSTDGRGVVYAHKTTVSQSDHYSYHRDTNFQRDGTRSREQREEDRRIIGARAINLPLSRTGCNAATQSASEPGRVREIDIESEVEKESLAGRGNNDNKVAGAQGGERPASGEEDFLGPPRFPSLTVPRLASARARESWNCESDCKVAPFRAAGSPLIDRFHGAAERMEALSCKYRRGSLAERDRVCRVASCRLAKGPKDGLLLFTSQSGRFVARGREIRKRTINPAGFLPGNRLGYFPSPGILLACNRAGFIIAMVPRVINALERDRCSARAMQRLRGAITRGGSRKFSDGTSTPGQRRRRRRQAGVSGSHLRSYNGSTRRRS